MANPVPDDQQKYNGAIRKEQSVLDLAMKAGCLAGEALTRAILFQQSVVDDPDAKPRTRQRAADFLRQCSRDAIAAAVASDNMRRLDDGESTSNVGITVNIVEIEG